MFRAICLIDRDDRAARLQLNLAILVVECKAQISENCSQPTVRSRPLP